MPQNQTPFFVLFFGPKKDPSSLSDQELISRYRQTEDTKFVGHLFTRYSHLISALSLKYLKQPDLVEDAVMDVFEILTRDLLQTDVANFKAWLYSVTKNHCLKKLRKRNSTREKEDLAIKSGALFVEFYEELDLENELLQSRRLDHLQSALGQLPEMQKSCLELFYLQDKSYKEVADETGYTLKQVKSYIQNGKRRLKGLLIEP